MNTISLLQLGRLKYADALLLQRRMVELRKEGRIGDVLLLLEHEPVITLGRNAKPQNVLASAEMLSGCGVEVFECDRGGDVTFHGPGQLVGYPIFDLRALPASDGKRKSMGAIEYVRSLEEVLIRTCADFAISTRRICGLTGVWTGTSAVDGICAGSASGSMDGTGSTARNEGKIAAIGVHISRSVTSHGFALNVNTDLKYFDLIIPCGITTKPVTSMAKESGREVSMEEVVCSVSKNFGFVFNSQILWLDSPSNLLPEPEDTPLQVPGDLRKIRGEIDTFRA